MLHCGPTLEGFRYHALVIWKLSFDETRHQRGAALPEHQMVLQRRHIHSLFLTISRKTADFLKRFPGHNNPEFSPKRHRTSGMRQAMAVCGHHDHLFAITDHEHATQG